MFFEELQEGRRCGEMLSKLLKIVKKGFRGLGQKGYTLIEVAAVVAVTATLAAVVVPVAMDKVKEGKLAAAKQDVATIAQALTQFNADTCLLYTSPSPRDLSTARMPSSA